MGKIFRSKVVSAARIERKHGGDENAPTAKLVYPDGYYGASLRGIRMAPQKVRLVVDQIRGKPVERAREILRYSSKRAAYYLDRVLLSALGNADAKSEGRVSAEDLIVAECYADEGTRLKRFMAGPKGGARPILRRYSHITVVLGPAKQEEKAEKKDKKGKKEKAA
ncbi:MAG TPA: 50S ribosomal protein L22 [Planctomycetota bacterium]|nr:50S ribosomal protein L22 [Planctomycetota bacterium]